MLAKILLYVKSFFILSFLLLTCDLYALNGGYLLGLWEPAGFDQIDSRGFVGWEAVLGENQIAMKVLIRNDESEEKVLLEYPCSIVGCASPSDDYLRYFNRVDDGISPMKSAEEVAFPKIQGRMKRMELDIGDLQKVKVWISEEKLGLDDGFGNDIWFKFFHSSDRDWVFYIQCHLHVEGGDTHDCHHIPFFDENNEMDF
ncbi:MAG: hypothetical protein OXB84_02010 [Halobacteriovoraceae bacterium]|nr:hypothetical protein [Halobacteriovoraceae bacterium]